MGARRRPVERVGVTDVAGGLSRTPIDSLRPISAALMHDRADIFRVLPRVFGKAKRLGTPFYPAEVGAGINSS